MKCEINLREFQRFDEGTKSLVLSRSEFVILAEAIYSPV
jgi:hypothetical protein